MDVLLVFLIINDGTKNLGLILLAMSFFFFVFFLTGLSSFGFFSFFAFFFFMIIKGSWGLKIFDFHAKLLTFLNNSRMDEALVHSFLFSESF